MLRMISIAMLPLFAGALQAAEPSLWKEVGNWTIHVDPAAGNGCFARREFDDGLVVEVGAVPKDAGGFFAAYNPAWTTIEDGAAGVVSFDFGDAKFEGDVVGIIRDGLPGGYAFFDNPEFTSEFGKRTSVSVSGENGTEVEVDLTGTSDAIEAVKACQAEQPEPPAE